MSSVALVCGVPGGSAVAVLASGLETVALGAVHFAGRPVTIRRAALTGISILAIWAPCRLFTVLAHPVLAVVRATSLGSLALSALVNFFPALTGWAAL